MNNIESVEEDGALSIEEVFGILSSPERRKTIYYLMEYGESSLYDITNHVNEELEEEKNLGTVAVELNQTHLPRMDKLDIIEYDREKNMAEYKGEKVLEETLDHASNYEDFNS